MVLYDPTSPMKSLISPFRTVFYFYVNGFRAMTWGRTLWIIILIKFILFFGIIRFVFLKPALGGLDNQAKSETVGRNLSDPTAP